MQKALYVVIILLHTHLCEGKYEPNWESLDKRPLPAWYDEAKFGIFMHWGVYSSIGFGPDTAGFWDKWRQNQTEYVNFIKKNYRPGITYGDMAADFHAELYDPDWWADLFQDVGAKYIVLTGKHHDGFALWPSKVNFNWNAMDVGPKRDLLGELGAAIRKKTDIRFGIYHNLAAFFHPLFLEDRKNKFQTQKYSTQVSIPELYEIVNNYKPDLIWSDGEFVAPEAYFNATYFLAWLYNESPVKDFIVTNDRWAQGLKCKHGGYWTCKDKYRPGKLLNHKWECCWTVDRATWGYRRNVNISDYYTTSELIEVFVSTVSFGGNFLLDIAPTGDGRIVPIFEQRLRQIGSWLKVNGEAIYGTKPWLHQNDTLTNTVWYTSKVHGNKTDVYAISLEWPDSGSLILGNAMPKSGAKVTLLGYNVQLKWVMKESNVMAISVPYISINKKPCDYAWTFKIENYYGTKT